MSNNVEKAPVFVRSLYYKTGPFIRLFIQTITFLHNKTIDIYLSQCYFLL